MHGRFPRRQGGLRGQRARLIEGHVCDDVGSVGRTTTGGGGAFGGWRRPSRSGPHGQGIRLLIATDADVRAHAEDVHRTGPGSDRADDVGKQGRVRVVLYFERGIERPADEVEEGAFFAIGQDAEDRPPGSRGIIGGGGGSACLIANRSTSSSPRGAAPDEYDGKRTRRHGRGPPLSV